MSDSEVQSKHPRNAFAWVIAGLFCLAAARLRMVTGLDSGTRELVCQVALFLAGMVVGAYFPWRWWRWALAGFVAFGLNDLVHLGDLSPAPESDSRGLLSHLAEGAPIWVVHALPVLIGAYVGARLSTRQGTT